MLVAASLHERRAPDAGVIAGALALDLDDVGAEIGQQLPGPGSGENAGELKHAQAGQRFRHSWNSPALHWIAVPRL